MPSLTKDLRKSLKIAKSGGKFAELRPVDLPEGVKTSPAGDFILPDDLARCADILYQTTQKRLALNRQVKRLEELETALEQNFINTMPKTSKGISGLVAHAKIVSSPVPVVDGEEGWEKLYTYIVKKRAFELLQRRLGKEAAQELIEAGEGGKAGLTVFQAKKVSVTKI